MTSISKIGQRFTVLAWICKVSTRIKVSELIGKATLYVCKVVSSTKESLRDHILEMMAYMNQLEYIDSSFDRNHAVDLLLDSVLDSYIDFLQEYHRESKSKTWIEVIKNLRRHEERMMTDKEERKKEVVEIISDKEEKHNNLNTQSRKIRESYFLEDIWVLE